MGSGEGLCVFPTPIGICAIAWRADLVVGAQLPEADARTTLARMQRRFPDLMAAPAPAWVRGVTGRIAALLSGESDDLRDVALDFSSLPPFAQRVYAIARAIPPGCTCTYGDVARDLGEPGAARAVGRALGDNPFAPIVPCHRILGAGNAGVGFSAEGGVATKLKMLQIERARIGTEPDLFD